MADQFRIMRNRQWPTRQITLYFIATFLHKERVLRGASDIGTIRSICLPLDPPGIRCGTSSPPPTTPSSVITIAGAPGPERSPAMHCKQY